LLSPAILRLSVSEPRKFPRGVVGDKAGNFWSANHLKEFPEKCKKKWPQFSACGISVLSTEKSVLVKFTKNN